MKWNTFIYQNMAKSKPETIIKRQEARLQDARLILSAQIMMGMNKNWSDAMSDKVNRFLKEFEI